MEHIQNANNKSSKVYLVYKLDPNILACSNNNENNDSSEEIQLKNLTKPRL